MNEKQEYRTISGQTKLMLANRESYDVDYKQNPNSITQEDIVSFANGRGGTILAGVKEESENGRQFGIVVGCNIGDKTQIALQNKATECRPSIEINIIVENSSKQPFLRIDIPESNSKPCCTGNGTYKKRIDGRNRTLYPEDLAVIFLEREATQFIERFKGASQELLWEFSKIKERIEGLDSAFTNLELIASESVEAAAAASEVADQTDSTTDRLERQLHEIDETLEVVALMMIELRSQTASRPTFERLKRAYFEIEARRSDIQYLRMKSSIFDGREENKEELEKFLDEYIPEREKELGLQDSGSTPKKERS